MLFDNHIIISNYNDINLNFKDYLTQKDSIIFKNCIDIKISISSKINKIIFINSKNVNLKCSETISGIEIEKCDNFKLLPMEPFSLKCIDCYRSYLELHIDSNIDIYNKFKLINQHSIIKIINSNN